MRGEDLTDEQWDALVVAAKKAFDADPHPYAPRIAPLKAALETLGVIRAPPAPKPPLPEAPMRSRGGKRVRR